MKMNPIFNLLRRTMFAALAATTIACGGDDPVVPQLPGGGNNGQNGTEEEKPEIKPDEGITLYGLVSDSEGNPLEGVVVSDGYSVVATDAKGVYQIVRSANAKYVFISAPSGYEIPTQANYGSYQGTYQAANSLTGSSTKPYRADFTLTKLSQSDTRFLLFGLGDPQPDNDEHIKRFRTETVPDVKKIKADYTIPTVGIALGDILGKGDAQTFTSMKRALGETGVPFFTTIGNHDKSSVDYTGDTYRDVLGPRWYSFNRGEVHFVAMDQLPLLGSGLHRRLHRRAGGVARKGSVLRPHEQDDRALLPHPAARHELPQPPEGARPDFQIPEPYADVRPHALFPALSHALA